MAGVLAVTCRNARAPRGYSVDSGGEAVWDPAIPADRDWLPVVYTLRRVDGDSVQVTLPEFLATCGELYPGELDAIRLLAPGEGYTSGGGASPEWSIVREMGPE